MLAKGTNAKLLIELSGSGVGSTANVGLKAEAPNVVIKGLVINSFSDSGVDIITPTATSDKVEGNFIGTDASGTQPLANGWYGVVASSGPSNNLIGGNTSAARNLISGNGGFGVEIADYRTTSTTSNNRISGNLIGTDKSSAEDLNNGEGGVFIVDASDNTVGGSKPCASNTIAFNRGYGVAVFSTTWVASPRDNILHNLIFYNWGIGISLNSDNRIPNDPGDTDSGPNGLQNYPVLQSAITSSGVTTIKGTLNTKPNSQYTVQFFSNPVGFGDQGMKFIGEQQLTTDSDGNDSFSYIPRRAVPAGLAASGYITATVTGDEGTSEFSAPTSVTVTVVERGKKSEFDSALSLAVPSKVAGLPSLGVPLICPPRCREQASRKSLCSILHSPNPNRQESPRRRRFRSPPGPTLPRWRGLTVSSLPPLSMPSFPQVGRCLLHLTVGENDQLEGFLPTVRTLLGPVLYPH
jgi:hypothetical protein